jgi:type I restriction enzyme S subunit
MSFPRYERYKDSGVQWLGEVPEHWNISRLGFEAWVRARLGWRGLKAEEYVDDGFVFLSTPNIKGRFIDFEDVNYIDEDRFLESPEIQLRQGDVLLAKDGSTLGTVNVVRGPAKTGYR